MLRLGAQPTLILNGQLLGKLTITIFVLALCKAVAVIGINIPTRWDTSERHFGLECKKPKCGAWAS